MLIIRKELLPVNERIKKLRKTLGLTQQEFADRIKVKRNTVATYEMGRSIPSDSAISLICREFGVYEEWLRNGIGEMFEARPTAALDALAIERNLSNGDYVFIEKFLNMKPDFRRTIIDFMREVSSALAQMEAEHSSASDPAYASLDHLGDPYTPDGIENRVAE